MSSNNFESTVDFSPRPSLLALKLLFLLHVGPVVLLPLAMESGTPMLVILGVFALSWFSLRRHPVFGYGPKALTRLTWHAPEDGQRGWTLHTTSGAQIEAQLRGDSYVHPRLMVLRFSGNDARTYTRVLLGDEADADTLRRLRARLSQVRDMEGG